MASASRNPSIKRLEKEITREGKAESSAVKQELQDLSRLQKDVRAAQKSAGNAASTLGKREQYEHKTAKRMNEAIHEHDLAVAKLRAAEKDLKLKHDHRARLMKELEIKKDVAEKAIQAQVEHDRLRETKVAQFRGVSISREPPLAPNTVNNGAGTGLPGQRGPAMGNNGHAAGYGVDFNHTAVDSEGNARAEN